MLGVENKSECTNHYLDFTYTLVQKRWFKQIHILLNKIKIREWAQKANNCMK